MKEFPSIIIRGDGERVGGGVTEEFKRSSHSDFATSKELRDSNFSGIRDNSITSNREVWIEGNLAATMSLELIRLRPTLWEELWRDTFALKDVKQIETKGN